MKGKALYVLFFLAATVFFSACNEDDTEPTVYSDSVRVSTFALATDTAVLENLSTVFFTIDLENGLIFNADSLPRGTDVSSLGVTITFEGASSAVITQADGTSFDYVESNSTKIDFSSPVEMTVVSQSGENSKTYQIKVNVHQVDPDFLSWGGMSYSSLPGSGQLEEQKTVQYNGMIYCFMRRGGAYSVAVATTPSAAWTVYDLQLPFVPDLSSLQAGDAMYMLDTEGNLYTSPDAFAWSATGSQYATLLGYWNGCLLTLTREGDTYYHDRYPAAEGYKRQPVAGNFPVTGMSDMLIYSSSWMTAPQGMIVGGRCADGSLTGAVWGYDGERWARLSSSMPAREDAMFFSYVTFIVDDNWVTTEQTAWFVIGGKGNTSTLRDVWLSTNYGITWQEASPLMQLPAYILSRSAASVVVCDEPNTALYASAWQAMDRPVIPDGYRAMPLRSAASADLVPYIYMIGGVSNEGVPFDQIWRGIINRLRFEPIP